MRILYVGLLGYGQTSLMRMQVLKQLGHQVQGLDVPPPLSLGKAAYFLYRATNRLGYPLDLRGINAAVLGELRSRSYDVLWLDSARPIARSTLRRAHDLAPRLLRMAYLVDDPFSRRVRGWKRFIQCVPDLDLIFVSRNENIEEFRAAGARRVERLQKGYFPELHRPVSLPPGYPRQEIFFGGHFEPKREKDLASLIDRGLPVSVAGHEEWRQGRFWNRIRPVFIPAVYGEEYTRILCSSKIALCFYSQWNRDQENSRMYEIPACGAFMLAERTGENGSVFEEGKEAEYFGTGEELVEKCRYYLAHDRERERIARAGHARCRESGYSYQHRLKSVLDLVEKVRNE